MQPTLLYGYVDSPIGTVEIGVQADHVTSLFFVDAPRQKDPPTNRILKLSSSSDHPGSFASFRW